LVIGRPWRKVRALATNRRISCIFSSWGIDNGDEMWLMESVTKEDRDVSTTPGRQPPVRVIFTLETAGDFTTEQSSDGGSDRHGGWASAANERCLA
jgi:hypothetical protein